MEVWRKLCRSGLGLGRLGTELRRCSLKFLAWSTRRLWGAVLHDLLVSENCAEHFLTLFVRPTVLPTEFRPGETAVEIHRTPASKRAFHYDQPRGIQETSEKFRKVPRSCLGPSSPPATYQVPDQATDT